MKYNCQIQIPKDETSVELGNLVHDMMQNQFKRHVQTRTDLFQVKHDLQQTDKDKLLKTRTGN